MTYCLRSKFKTLMESKVSGGFCIDKTDGTIGSCSCRPDGNVFCWRWARMQRDRLIFAVQKYLLTMTRPYIISAHNVNLSVQWSVCMSSSSYSWPSEILGIKWISVKFPSQIFFFGKFCWGKKNKYTVIIWTQWKLVFLKIYIKSKILTQVFRFFAQYLNDESPLFGGFLQILSVGLDGNLCDSHVTQSEDLSSLDQGFIRRVPWDIHHSDQSFRLSPWGTGNFLPFAVRVQWLC